MHLEPGACDKLEEYITLIDEAEDIKEKTFFNCLGSYQYVIRIECFLLLGTVLSSLHGLLHLMLTRILQRRHDYSLPFTDNHRESQRGHMSYPELYN